MRPDDKRLGQHLFGLDFPNPVGMAAGFDKRCARPRELLAMGFGFVEVGTLTPRAQSGNPSPRIFRSGEDRAIINRLGFNNEGQEAALARLKAGSGGIVGVNLGAGRDSTDRIGDYVEGIVRMAPVASYFTINISSPNTPGLRDLQAPEALAALLARRAAARARRGSQAAASGQARARSRRRGPAGDRAGDQSHTAPTGSSCRTRHCRGMGLRDAAFAKEAGGLSGRPLFARATRMLARVYRLTEGKLPLIGVGGIDSGETALAKIEAGASLIQLYTGLVFEGLRSSPASSRRWSRRWSRQAPKI